MMSAWASAWRLEDCGRSGVWVLFDARNAFACTPHERLEAAATSWLGESASFVSDWLRWGWSLWLDRRGISCAGPGPAA